MIDDLKVFCGSDNFVNSTAGLNEQDDLSKGSSMKPLNRTCPRHHKINKRLPNTFTYISTLHFKFIIHVVDSEASLVDKVIEPRILLNQ